MDSRIVWRRLDQPGYEAARIRSDDGAWRLEGCAIFTEDDQSCCIQYEIRCGSDWRFERARVKGWIENRDIDLEIEAGQGKWSVNREVVEELRDCIDLDLNFSPSTNTLPIRRLKLDIGESALVSAAWLRFPSLKLERLDQTYTRTDERTYRYETADGKFKRELTVNEAGLVVIYPGLWEAELSGSTKS